MQTEYDANATKSRTTKITMTTALFHSLALAVLFATFGDTRADINDEIQTEGDLMNENTFRNDNGNDNDNGEIRWWVGILIVFLLIIGVSIIAVAYCLFCMKLHGNDTRCQGGIFRILYCGSIITSVPYFFGCRKRNTEDVRKPGKNSDNSTQNESVQIDIEFGTGKSVNSHSSNTENSPTSFTSRTSKSIYSQDPKTGSETIITDNNDNAIRSQKSIASWQDICNVEDADNDNFSEADSDDIQLLEILEEKYAEKVEKKRQKEVRHSLRKLQKKSERNLQNKSQKELQKKSKQALEKLSNRALEAPYTFSDNDSTVSFET